MAMPYLPINPPFDEQEMKWMEHAIKLRARANEYEARATRHWQKRIGQIFRKKEKENDVLR